MAKWVKNEFWVGYTVFEKLFFAGMVALQLLVYCLYPDSLLGMVSGVTGVIGVALTAKGKLSSYWFAFINMATYMVICWDNCLFLEFGEQAFYFLTAIWGLFTWNKNMIQKDDGTKQVAAKKFVWWQWLVALAATVMSTALLGYFGDTVLGSNLSYLDASTAAMAVIAQLLMVWRYREQWVIWVVIDIASLVMFAMLSEWSMVAMYVAWTINAIYGWYNWSKLEKD